jgi:hypothetical protein
MISFVFVALQVMMDQAEVQQVDVEEGARNPVAVRRSLEDFSNHLLKIPLGEHRMLINGFCCG